MLNVKLDVFEGPFDLLFKLIEKHKIDIYDIPMALITEKYVQEVEKMEEKNIDNIGEFLTMAATLLKIKSKMLLPSENMTDEEDVDPRLELVSRLLEYKRYKEVAETLKEMEEKVGTIAFKQRSEILDEIKHEIDYDDFFDGIDMNALTEAFLKVVRCEKKREDENSIEETKKNITSTVRRKRVYTIEMQMSVIFDKLNHIDNLNFDELFCNEDEKMAKVMTFLALLEMIKMKKIKVEQDKTFGEINISKAEYFSSAIEYSSSFSNEKQIANY